MEHLSNTPPFSPNEPSPLDPDLPPQIGPTRTRRILTDTAHYFLSLLGARVALFAGGIVVARVLGPADYGLWRALGLLAAYSIYASLGTISALNREVPYWLAKGDLAQAQRIRDVVGGTMLVTSGLFAVGVLIASFVSRPWLSPLMIHSLRLVALLMLAQHAYRYFETLFRTTHDFTTVWRLRLLSTILDVGLAVILIFPWHLYGRIVAQILAYGSIVAVLLWRRPFPLRPTLSWTESRALVGIGIPLMTASFLTSILITIDSLMVLKVLGRTALGYYSVGVLVFSALLIVPTVVNEILYPRFAERFGETDSPLALRAYVLAPTLLLAWGFPLVIGAAYLVLPPTVAWALPVFTPGVKAARLLLLGAFFLTLCGGPGHFLNTTGRQAHFMVTQGAGLIVAACLNALALALGWGIEGVALATTTTYLLLFFALLSYVYISHFGTARQCGRFLIQVTVPFLLMGLMITLLDVVLPSPPVAALRPVIAASVKGVLFLSAFGFLVLRMARGNREVQTLAQAVGDLPVLGRLLNHLAFGGSK
ncbi:oligosaccharide flippase family protein [Nitrospinae bacterium AH_259_B05_G02_I21]|nr:oligosaccharide flippase family protein [Nitrospinae bacterium AH_259_B05_G02_I21]